MSILTIDHQLCLQVDLIHCKTTSNVRTRKTRDERCRKFILRKVWTHHLWVLKPCLLQLVSHLVCKQAAIGVAWQIDWILCTSFSRLPTSKSWNTASYNHRIMVRWHTCNKPWHFVISKFISRYHVAIRSSQSRKVACLRQWSDLRPVVAKTGSGYFWIGDKLSAVEALMIDW